MQKHREELLVKAPTELKGDPTHNREEEFSRRRGSHSYGSKGILEKSHEVWEFVEKDNIEKMLTSS